MPTRYYPSAARIPVSSALAQISLHPRFKGSSCNSNQKRRRTFCGIGCRCHNSWWGWVTINMKDCMEGILILNKASTGVSLFLLPRNAVEYWWQAASQASQDATLATECLRANRVGSPSLEGQWKWHLSSDPTYYEILLYLLNSLDIFRIILRLDLSTTRYTVYCSMFFIIK